MTGTIILCFPCKDRHAFHSCMLLQESVKSEKCLAEAECEAGLPTGELPLPSSLIEARLTPFTIKGNVVVCPWCAGWQVLNLTVADVVKSQSHVITRVDSPGRPEHSRARIKLSEGKTNAPASRTADRRENNKLKMLKWGKKGEKPC